MIRFPPIFLIVVALSKSSLGVSLKEAPGLGKVFKDQNVVGTFILYDVAADTMLVWNQERAKRRFIPVGWVERENKIFPFALNIDMPSDEDAAKRIPVGRECLKVLGKLSRERQPTR